MGGERGVFGEVVLGTRVLGEEDVGFVWEVGSF